MIVKVTVHNIHKNCIRWRISTSTNVVRLVFATVLTVIDILMSQICELENLGQGREVQRSQRSYAMAKISLYKSHT